MNVGSERSLFMELAGHPRRCSQACVSEEAEEVRHRGGGVALPGLPAARPLPAAVLWAAGSVSVAYIVLGNEQ